MNWLSIFPPLATILITFKTKKLIPALLAGIIIGALLQAKSVMGGLTSIGGYVIGVLSEKGSAYALSFLIIYGALSEIISMAGGIAGFSEKIEKHVKSERGLLGWTWALSLPTFFNSSFHFISVGTALNRALDKVKASREKFAYILSITSLQLILLIPIASANIGYMVTLASENFKNSETGPYAIVTKSILWNFYSWSMILLALGVTFFSLGFGKIRFGRAKSGELTQMHVERKKRHEQPAEEYPSKISNLIVPIAILLICTIFLYWWTGRSKAQSFLGALSQADFNVSLFTGAIITLVLTSVYYLFQKISLAEIQAHFVKGSEKVMGLVVILIMSWTLAKVTQDLGFSNFIKDILPTTMPKLFIPVIVFTITGIISYTIGSSWATWALMIPTAAAFSASAGLDVSLMAGTVWAGGAVAEVVSPVAAEMAGIPYNKHFVTALPYALAGMLIAAIGYVITGFLV